MIIRSSTTSEFRTNNHGCTSSQADSRAWWLCWPQRRGASSRLRFYKFSMRPSACLRSKNSAEDRVTLLPSMLVGFGRCNGSFDVELASTGYLVGFCQETFIPISQRSLYLSDARIDFAIAREKLLVGLKLSKQQKSLFSLVPRSAVIFLENR